MKLKLTGRFIVILLAVGLIPVCALAILSFRSTEKIADGKSALLRESAVTAIDTIERNLFERYGDVQAFATNSMFRYLDPQDADAKAAFTEALNTYVRIYGIYPLSVITDGTGKVVAANTRDAAGRPLDTSFLIGRDFSQAPWFLAAREERFLKSDLLDGTVVDDVALDADIRRALGRDAMTIGYSAPIKDADGKFIGVWRNYADFSVIVEAIIQSSWASRTNGDKDSTLEFFLLRDDGVLLTHYNPADAGTVDLKHDYSRVLKVNASAEEPAFRPALAPGARGVTRYLDEAEGHWHLAGYAKSVGALGYPGLGWSLIVLDEEDHLHADVNAANRATLITVVVSAALLAAVAWLIARSLTRPIQACVTAMDQLAAGDLTVSVDLKRTDELGTLGRAIDTCAASLRKLVGDLNRSAAALQQSARTLGETATSQAAAAEETTVQAGAVASAGEQLSANARSMSASAAQITQSTTTVASAMEEMSSSIQEVARNCAQESEIARQADTQTRQTRDLMAKLDDSARQIGKVVELINRIAEQTNLLALNATIEAASAGEAGRGFAVVANEVKELARQSASATEDIRRQIALIQDNTGSSIKSLDQVAQVIAQVSHISSSIAAAVEEQSATTSEIVGTIHQVASASSSLSSNVQQTADGAAEVARNISGVSQAASDGAQGAAHVNSSASELNRLSAELGSLVARFKV